MIGLHWLSGLTVALSAAISGQQEVRPLVVPGTNPAGSSQAAPTPFSFRDLRVGAAVPKDTKKAGYRRCERITIFTTCTFDWDLKVGGVQAFGDASFRNAGLYELQLTFGRAVAPQIRAALQERYGPPCSTKVVDVGNELGAKFTRETVTWCFADGVASFDSIGSTPGEARFGFLSNDELERRAPSKPKVDF